MMVVGVALGGADMSWGAESLPVTVPANSAEVHLMGRFDTTDAMAPACDWAGSEMALRFTGTAVNVKLKEAGNNYYQVVLDGAPTTVIKPTKTESLYAAATDLKPGEHTLQVIKRTEPSQGKTQFLGFELSQGGKALPWTAQVKHRIEFVGDSITCGYGNEGAKKEEHYLPATQNCYLTFGAMTARNFEAEYTCIAWSGRTMAPKFTMPSIWDLTLAKEPKAKWDFSKWQADAVVVGLATNEFNKTPPEEKLWVGAYEEFLARVRKAYPEAHIFCSTSPMMYGDKAKLVKTYLTEIIEDLNKAGDAKVHLLEIKTQNGNLGYGSDWHPNVKNHEVIAETLTKALVKELGWTVTKSAEQK